MKRSGKPRPRRSNGNFLMRIFVLADTHNHLPENLEALAAGADEIWHLGDVCAPNLVVRLENIGLPLTLVRGNCDSNHDWPLVVDLERNGLRFRLVHIPPSHVPEDVDILLHAHTHVPRNERKDGVRDTPEPRRAAERRHAGDRARRKVILATDLSSLGRVALATSITGRLSGQRIVACAVSAHQDCDQPDNSAFVR